MQQELARFVKEEKGFIITDMKFQSSLLHFAYLAVS